MKFNKYSVVAALVGLCVIGTVTAFINLFAREQDTQNSITKTVTTCSAGNNHKHYYRSRGETDMFYKDLSSYQEAEKSLCAGLGKVTLELHQ